MAASATTTQQEINSLLWKSCDTFRSIMDSSDYKNYILVMLFVKYISDVWKERREELTRRYGDNDAMLARQLSRERFILPEHSSFDYLYSQRKISNIGELIDIALAQIEEANHTKLEGVFRNISFNSDTLGEKKDLNRRLVQLLEEFADPRLDLRPSRVTEDIIGNAYMYLIENFAGSAGKKGGEFYTPTGVSLLLAKLLRAQPGDRICDPTCGSGSLLIRVAEAIPEHERHNYSLFGQEVNGGTWALCRMNMVLHDEDSAIIHWGDTLNNPRLLEDDLLMQFNVVVANPPFSLDKWGAEYASNDKFRRYWRGTPPKSKADFAFITHMVETALPQKGRVGVIVPHGVLFRGGAEGAIRRKLIEDNLLDAVIGLPENLFFGTGIPAAILLFDRTREEGGPQSARDEVLFIDAGSLFQPGKNQNSLPEAGIERIAAAYHARTETARFSRRVPVAELRENDYNLNIPRYIDTFQAREEVDIAVLQQEIGALETELASVRGRLASHLEELDVVY